MRGDCIPNVSNILTIRIFSRQSRDKYVTGYDLANGGDVITTSQLSRNTHHIYFEETHFIIPDFYKHIFLYLITTKLISLNRLNISLGCFPAAWIRRAKLRCPYIKNVNEYSSTRLQKQYPNTISLSGDSSPCTDTKACTYDIIQL